MISFIIFIKPISKIQTDTLYLVSDRLICQGYASLGGKINLSEKMSQNIEICICKLANAPGMQYAYKNHFLLYITQVKAIVIDYNYAENTDASLAYH